MAYAAHSATRSGLSRWLLVAFTLLGFLGQLLIQNQAQPGEMPRATILRLTGIDIAPGGGDTKRHLPCCPPGDADRAGMSMGGMGSDMAQAMPDDHDDHHAPGHHPQQDGSCPLCPMLHLPVVLFTVAPLLPVFHMVWQRYRIHMAQPRAPPAIELGVPLSRGLL